MWLGYTGCVNITSVAAGRGSINPIWAAALLVAKGTEASKMTRQVVLSRVGPYILSPTLVMDYLDERWLLLDLCLIRQDLEPQ